MKKKSCIFAERVINKKGEVGCQACKKYYCETEDCSFYKSKDEYELVDIEDIFYGMTTECRKKVKNGTGKEL